MVTVMGMICTYCQHFHLFEPRGQVLDEKSPEVVECLQLSALCEARKTQVRQTKKHCADIKGLVHPIYTQTNPYIQVAMRNKPISNLADYWA